jgi:hypothetical protein
MSYHKRWTEYRTYADFLDVPIDTKNKPPRLAQAIEETHRATDGMMAAFGSGELTLRRLRERGLHSSRYEPRRFPGGPC